MRKVCIDNCLATRFPKIAAEWHSTKNGNLPPFDVSYGSNRKVWWICKKGHEWQSAITYRSSGCGCPYCSNQKVCIENCLATKSPKIAAE
jgi:hypothetical protein